MVPTIALRCVEFGGLNPPNSWVALLFVAYLLKLTQTLAMLYVALRLVLFRVLKVMEQIELKRSSSFILSSLMGAVIQW